VFARLGSIINIENADFESNVGEQSAITAVVGVTMHVQSSNFVNNKSLIGAAAIYCEHNSFMNVESSTFSSNENPNGGAILANDGATVNVANSNFNNNYATHYGGAISGSLQAYINVANSNFIGNTAGLFSGAIWIDQKTVVILNTVAFQFNSDTCVSWGSSFFPVFNMLHGYLVCCDD